VRRRVIDEANVEASSSVVDAGLTHAVATFFPEEHAVEPVGEHLHLARVETAGGVWCVQRWPAGTTRDRVEFVQTVLHASREAGFAVVPKVAAAPDGQTTLAIDGALYDARSWLPGRAPVRGPDLVDERGRGINRPTVLPAATLTAAVRTIAGWHAATERFVERAEVPRAPLDGVLRVVRGAWEEQRERLRLLAPRTPHIQRWVRSGEVVIAGAVETLAAAEYLRSRPMVVGHLNLWPAHLLVSRVEGQERISGLIDFGEAAASSPLVDLAQLIGHFNGWTGAAAEEAIGAYTDVRPLAPEERRLLPAVAGLDLVMQTGRLLTLGYATRAIAETGGGDTIRAGAAALLLSLEAVAPAVQRGDRPEPSRARKWDYGPRPARARRGGGTR
jgi:phosphotransferase family enzyme